jgi:hypothetical protein
LRDDNGTSSAPGNLSVTAKYASNNTPITIRDDFNPSTNEPVHSVLLRKKDGRYYFIFWQTAESYNSASATRQSSPSLNKNVNPISINLTINTRMSKGSIIDPLTTDVGGRSTPDSLYRLEKFNTNNPATDMVASFSQEVRDYPLILELVPRTP